MISELTQISLYQIGIVLIVLTITFRLIKEISPCQKILQAMGFVILMGWLIYFLEMQFPVLVKNHLDEDDKYVSTNAFIRDWRQEYYPLNEVSGAIGHFIPANTKQPLLIIFPESYIRKLQPDWAAYWDRRLRYRHYPMKLDLVVRDSTGNYYDFYDRFSSTSTKPVFFSPLFLYRYPLILYLYPEGGKLPKGFQEWRWFGGTLIARQVQKR